MIKRSYPWAVLPFLLLSSCVSKQVVGFQNDIEPILKKKCQQCHVPPNGIGYVRTGLNMESYDTLMDGTIFGTVIIPGDSKRSLLNKLVEGRVGELVKIPHDDVSKLTAEEVEFLKLWVEQGALNN